MYVWKSNTALPFANQTLALNNVTNTRLQCFCPLSRIFCLHFTQTLHSDVCIVHVHIPTMMKIQPIGHVIWSAKGDWCFTSLKTGYITAYSVMDTMEFVSASFFISSIVILQGGAALGEKVRRKLQLTHTHAYTHPLTHTHSHTLWKTNKLQSDKSLTKRKIETIAGY